MAEAVVKGKLSVIVNTCSLGPMAKTVTGSHSDTPHFVRAYALRHFILPHYTRYADEVIVVGEYAEGDGYTYLYCPSEYFSAVDALAQRHEGYSVARGGWLAFVHDDHWLDLTDADYLDWRSADVWVPRRYRAGEGELINGMHETPPYIGGHCAIYSRQAIESAPWNAVPKVWTWDVEHTRMLGDDLTAAETDRVRVWDVEA